MIKGYGPYPLIKGYGSRGTDRTPCTVRYVVWFLCFNLDGALVPAHISYLNKTATIQTELIKKDLVH